jgi:hypothetical protein
MFGGSGQKNAPAQAESKGCLIFRFSPQDEAPCCAARNRLPGIVEPVLSAALNKVFKL